MQIIDILEQLSQLTDFQKEQLKWEIIDFIQFNELVQNMYYSVCPVRDNNDINGYYIICSFSNI